jgi:hypothetical protein
MLTPAYEGKPAEDFKDVPCGTPVANHNDITPVAGASAFSDETGAAPRGTAPERTGLGAKLAAPHLLTIRSTCQSS